MERMKLTEKEKEQILKSGAEAMSKIIERMSIEMGELEEENRELKKECEENNYLVEDNARWMKRCEEKTMEVKKLKSDLAFERTMLDNVRAEYKSLQNVNKKLKGENETLKEELISRIRQPKNVPYGKGVAELMEEDTLQELRDIGEI